MNTPELVVVVQPTQLFRLNLPRLRGSGDPPFAVVTSPGQLEAADRGRFAWVAEVERFDADTLTRVLGARGATGSGVRLVTGSETEVRACARARAALGIPGPRELDVDCFLDKDAMKRRVAASAPDLVGPWLLAPPAEEVDDAVVASIVASLGLPIFAKPIESVGSEGTRRLDDRAALEGFLQTPRARPFELDTFLDGPVFNADAVLVDGQICWFGACELLHPPASVLGGATHASWAIDPDEPEFDALLQLTERVIEACRPPDGAVHLEAIRTVEGFRFLEVACRNAGWLIPEAYEAATGVNLRVAHLRAAAGLDPHVAVTRRGSAGYFMGLKTRPGRVRRRVDPPLAVAHRVVHRPERADGAPARALMLADLLCEVVAWDDDPRALRQALAGLDGFEPFELDAGA